MWGAGAGTAAMRPSWVNCASCRRYGHGRPTTPVGAARQATSRVQAWGGSGPRVQAAALASVRHPASRRPTCLRASQISCFRCPRSPLVASLAGELTSATPSPGAAGGSDHKSQMGERRRSFRGRGGTHRFKAPVGRCRRMRQRRGAAPLLAHRASNCQQHLNWGFSWCEKSVLSTVCRPPSPSPRNAEPFKAWADQRRPAWVAPTTRPLPWGVDGCSWGAGQSTTTTARTQHVRLGHGFPPV